MSEEIKRNRWRPFLRQLNKANRYHPITITYEAMQNSDSHGLTREFTIEQFMGITLQKSKGRINALEVAQATPDPERIAQPIAIIDDPTRMLVKKTKHGTITQIIIADKLGNRTNIKFSAVNEKANSNRLVEKLAYAIFQRRGSEPGYHANDWLEAEEKIRKIEAEIVN